MRPVTRYHPNPSPLTRLWIHPPMLIFLDFDGVLHPNLCPGDRHFVHAQALADTIGAAEVDIVISSSWRFHHSPHDLVQRLPEALGRRIIGATGEPCIGRFLRHREILGYLGKYRIRERWIALDDSAWEFPPDCRELIRCDGSTGIGERELVRVAAFLARP